MGVPIQPETTRQCLPALAAGLLFALLASVPGGVAGQVGSLQSDAALARKVQVYVTDFELSAAGPVAARKRTRAQATGQPQGNDGSTTEDSPQVLAQRIIDFFAVTLTQTLRQDGYFVMRRAGKLPSQGVALRGVFAEVDERNHIRKAILGGGATGAKFTLYIGAFNLAAQDQPLYLEAPVQSPDPHYGPVITLNAYIPLVKYQLDKNLTEEEVKKVCWEITSRLTQLLQSNPEAFER